MRIAAALTAAVGLAFLTASCGGGKSSTSSGGQGGASGPGGVLAFSGCMRTHGLAKFPDPIAGGRLTKVSPAILKVSSSRFGAAEGACQHLLPATGRLSGGSVSVERCIVGGVCPSGVTHWLQSIELRFAACMRSHGVPGWPDPTTDSVGRVGFDVSQAWVASPPEPADSKCGRLTRAPIG